LIGKLIGTFGNKGELKLFSAWTVDIEIFIGKELCVHLPNNIDKEVVLKSARRHKNVFPVNLDPYCNIESAKELIGGDVYTNDKYLSRENGEIYFSDIDGFECCLESGKIFGRLVGFKEVPQYDLFVIERKDGSQIDIPNIPEFVKTIERINRKIIFFSNRIKNYYED
jgi:16S rRNA processing protein RimM